MSSGPLLGAGDLQLIHLVVAHRRGEAAGSLDAGAAAALLGDLRDAGGSRPPAPFERAARLTGGVAGLLPGAPGRQVALLALLCQIRLDGYQLTAPQGVLAAMVARTAENPREWEALARWLDDRAMAVAPPGAGVGW